MLLQANLPTSTDQYNARLQYDSPSPHQHAPGQSLSFNMVGATSPCRRLQSRLTPPICLGPTSTNQSLRGACQPCSIGCPHAAGSCNQLRQHHITMAVTHDNIISQTSSSLLGKGSCMPYSSAQLRSLGKQTCLHAYFHQTTSSAHNFVGGRPACLLEALSISGSGWTATDHENMQADRSRDFRSITLGNEHDRAPCAVLVSSHAT